MVRMSYAWSYATGLVLVSPSPNVDDGGLSRIFPSLVGRQKPLGQNTGTLMRNGVSNWASSCVRHSLDSSSRATDCHDTPISTPEERLRFGGEKKPNQGSC